MRRLIYRRRPSAAQSLLERVAAVGFLRLAVENDVYGSRMVAWVRRADEERLVRSIAGEPDLLETERVDSDALKDWKVKLGAGAWLLGPGVAAPKGTKISVLMPVGAGFGLGDHPTTVLASALLLRHDVAGKRVFDLGCGSGVLAALAGKMGATTIDATDLDHDAVLHTRKTLKANGVVGKAWTSDLLKKVPAKKGGAATYDLVCANLVGDLLAEFLVTGDLPRILAPGAPVILSGISDAKLPAVTEALKTGGWKVRGRNRHADGWTGFIVTHKG